MSARRTSSSTGTAENGLKVECQNPPIFYGAFAWKFEPLRGISHFRKERKESMNKG